jgi:hypothetical protein
MSSTKAVCTHKHPLVQSGTKQINRYKWSTNRNISVTELLAKQQLFTAQ